MPIPRINPNTGEPQTLDEIRDWHQGIVDALFEQSASVHHAIRTGSRVAPRFVGMTEGEVDMYFDEQRRELDRLTMLNFVASAEATIRVDYFRRVGDKLKNPLALAYRDWHKNLPATKQLRPDFDEGGILDVLKQANVMDNNIIGRYRECLRARHWVGHGRYWEKPVEVERLDPEDVFSRADALLRAIPN